MLDLKRKFCDVPFRNFEASNSGDVTSCCYVTPNGKSYPSSYKLGNLYEQSIEEIWNGEAALNLRKSILDGSFSYCNKDYCPKFANNMAGLADKDDAKSYHWDIFSGININETECIRLNDPVSKALPSRLYLNTSLVCNYLCPTCTVALDKVNYEDKILKTVREKKSAQLLNELRRLTKTANYIFFGGRGEPLFSKAVRDWLKNLDQETIGCLSYIEIQTNGSLFNKTFWESLPQEVRDKISVVQVSVDAATKDTYENQNRINGQWDVLWANLKYIRTLKEVKTLILNFVVQDNNYLEMPLFVELAKELNAKVRFYKVAKWPLMAAEKFNEINVFDENHPSHKDFLGVLNQSCFNQTHVELTNFAKSEGHEKNAIQAQIL